MAQPDELIFAEQRKAVTVEKVVQAALFVASDNFNQREDDPGWGAEMHEEMLDEAIREAAAEMNVLAETKRQLGYK